MSDDTPRPDQETTQPEELNPDGVGGTFGARDTFEPEESEQPEDSDS